MQLIIKPRIRRTGIGFGTWLGEDLVIAPTQPHGPDGVAGRSMRKLYMNYQKKDLNGNGDTWTVLLANVQVYING